METNKWTEQKAHETDETSIPVSPVLSLWHLWIARFPVHMSLLLLILHLNVHLLNMMLLWLP